MAPVTRLSQMRKPQIQSNTEWKHGGNMTQPHLRTAVNIPHKKELNKGANIFLKSCFGRYFRDINLATGVLFPTF